MEAFVARQPIFDRRLSVYAYELLFRSGLENYFSHDNPDEASAKLISNSYLLMGLETLTGGKKAFLNATRDTLVQGYVELMPRDQVVVEILETVEADDDVLAAARQLKEKGYQIALDDFDDRPSLAPLLDLADIIKVDFQACDSAERQRIVETYGGGELRLLAEKVETPAELEEARGLGYSLFQGFFFSHPVVVSARDLPVFKGNCLLMLIEVHKPELDFARLEALTKREMALSYKLLRYVNSPFFRRGVEIGSIRQALALLGDNEIRRWASLIALATMGEDKPQELVLQAAIRGRFCESLAPAVSMDSRAGDLFLLGMFSLLESIMGRPLQEIVKEIPLAPDVKAALLRGDGRMGQVLDYALAYEIGAWDDLAQAGEGLRLDEANTPGLYLDAIQWSHDSMGPLLNS